MLSGRLLSVVIINTDLPFRFETNGTASSVCIIDDSVILMILPWGNSTIALKVSFKIIPLTRLWTPILSSASAVLQTIADMLVLDFPNSC